MISCILINSSILGEQQVKISNFADAMEPLMRRYVPKLISRLAPKRKRVGVLISGSGTNLQSLIDATLDPTKHMGAEIVLVISNKPSVEGLKRAERAGIATKVGHNNCNVAYCILILKYLGCKTLHVQQQRRI